MWCTRGSSSTYLSKVVFYITDILLQIWLVDENSHLSEFPHNVNIFFLQSIGLHHGHSSDTCSILEALWWMGRLSHSCNQLKFLLVIQLLEMLKVLVQIIQSRIRNVDTTRFTTYLSITPNLSIHPMYHSCSNPPLEHHRILATRLCPSCATTLESKPADGSNPSRTFLPLQRRSTNRGAHYCLPLTYCLRIQFDELKLYSITELFNSTNIDKMCKYCYEHGLSECTSFSCDINWLQSYKNPISITHIYNFMCIVKW